MTDNPLRSEPAAPLTAPGNLQDTCDSYNASSGKVGMQVWYYVSTTTRGDGSKHHGITKLEGYQADEAREKDRKRREAKP